MASQYEEMKKVNKELIENDPNGTMTKNPGGNRMKTRESLNKRLREGHEGIITDPANAKKAGRAAGWDAVREEIDAHTEGTDR